MEDTIKYIDDKYEGAAKYLYEVLYLLLREYWGPSPEQTAAPLSIQHCMRACWIGSSLLMLCKESPEIPM